MKGSWMTSLTSQLVLIIALAIVVMQLYKFFMSGEILDLFNTLASMVLGAYFQRQVSKNASEKEIIGDSKPSLEGENEELEFISQKFNEYNNQ